MDVQEATPVIVPPLVNLSGKSGSDSGPKSSRSSRSMSRQTSQASIATHNSQASVTRAQMAHTVATPPPSAAINFKTVMMAERFPVHSFEAEAPPTLKGSARRTAIASKKTPSNGIHALPFYTAANASECARIGLAPPKSDPVFNTAEENKRAARAGQVQYKTPALNRHRRYLKELAEARKAAAAKAAEEEEAKVAHMTKLRETSKSIRKAIAEGVPEKAKAKAFATPRDTPRDTPRPGSGASGVKATPRGSKKPAWAMTGKEADDVEKAEAEELLAFSESLDIGEFLHDFEVRQALEAVQSRIDTLKAGGDAGIDQGGEASDGGDNEDQGEQLHSGASNGEQGEGDELGGSHGQDRIDLTKEGWKGEFASWWNRAVASGSSDDWETSSTRPSRDGLESVSERSSGGSDTPRVRRDSDMVSSVSSMSRISRASNLTTLSSGSHASLKAVLAENMGSIRQVHSPASLRAVINRMMAQKKARGGSGGGDGQEEGGSQDLRKSVTWAEQASIRGGSTSGTIQSLLAQQSGSGIGRGN